MTSVKKKMNFVLVIIGWTEMQVNEEQWQGFARKSFERSARMPDMKRRTLLHALSTLPAAAMLPATAWTAAKHNGEKSPEGAPAVYELRVYYAAPGKLNELLTRFREHTLKLFIKHGMKSVAYWLPMDEPQKSNVLFYILEHASREAAAASWKAFGDDPEWKSVKDKSEANGKLVDKIESTFLALTDFSPKL
jgi:hypothetical protein